MRSPWVLRAASAISAVGGALTAIAGVVTWLRGGSFAQGIHLAVVWSGRAVYLLCIPWLLMLVIGGVFWVIDTLRRGRKGNVRLTLSVVACLFGLYVAILAIVRWWRIAVVEDVGLWLNVTGTTVLASACVATGVMAWEWRETRRERWHECPDCCSDVLVRARVCRHCGYRFEPPPAAPSPS